MTQAVRPYTNWDFELALASDASSPEQLFVSYKTRVDGPITIARGRSAEDVEAIQPGSMTVRLDNADDELTVENALSSLPGPLQFGKLGRVTEWVDTALRDVPTRTVSNGWGTPEGDGAAWTTSGGSASDYSAGSNVLTHSVGAVNSSRRTVNPVNLDEVDYYGEVRIRALATGASVSTMLTLVYQDADNMLMADIQWGTSGSVTLNLIRRLATVQTSLGTAGVIGTYAANDWWAIRASFRGGVLRAKAWSLAGLGEPLDWQIEVADSSFVGDPGSVGCRTILNTSNTNTLPFLADYRNLLALDGLDTRFLGQISDVDPDTWTDDGDKATTLTFADQLDLRQRSDPYVSTLGGWIAAKGREAYDFRWWPLNDPGLEFLDVTGASPVPITRYTYTFEQVAEARSGAADPIPGDDINTVEVVPPESESVAGFSAAPFRALLTDATIQLGSPETHLTMLVWCYRTVDLEATQVTRLLYLSTTADTDSVGIYNSTDPTGWQAGVVLDSGLSSVDNVGPLTESSTERWSLVGVQIDLDAETLSLWVDDQDPATDSIGGGPLPAFVAFDELILGNAWYGALAHLQIYTGRSDVFTHADFLEQYALGLGGLEGQLSGERVATLADWAGITRTDIDTGVAVLQPARLAGLTEFEGMSTAVDTENGDLFDSKAGVLTFRGRQARLNRASDVTIPKAWVDDGLLPRLDGPVFNSYETTNEGGVVARAKNAASIARQGVKPGVRSIASATTADARNASAWWVYNYADERVRVPVLPITLQREDEADQQVIVRAILPLEIGHRADLDGMPATYPAGASALMIEGYRELIGEAVRRIEFVTSPVLGIVPGTADTWFRLDDATLGELDAGNKLAF